MHVGVGVVRSELVPSRHHRLQPGAAHRHLCRGLPALLFLACGQHDVDVLVRRPPSSLPMESTPLSTSAPVSIEPVPAPSPSAEDLGVPVPIMDGSVNPSLDAGVGVERDAAPCAVGAVVVVNRYRFRWRADGRCVATGTPLTLGGVRTWYAELTEECSDSDSLWQFVQDPNGTFEIRHALWDFNLDIERGGTQLGTDALLYPPSDLLNQRFSFDERADGYVAIRPRHARSRCLAGALDDRVELAECEQGLATDEWMIEPMDCMPDGLVSGP